MLFRVLGALLVISGIVFAGLAWVAAGPQPALDANDLAFNQRIFLFFGGGAAVLLLGGLATLLSTRTR